MKIVKWLAPSGSSINGTALIEVEPDEVADIEQMLILIDGDSVGHFGLSVRLVATGTMPVIKLKKHRGKTIGAGYYDPEAQFGYSNASIMKSQKRYYKCHVDRD